MIALITYTPNQPVPADIALASAMLVGHWLLYQIDPMRYGLSNYTLGRDVEVTQSGQQTQRVIPADVQAILDGYTRPVFA